MLSVPHLIVIFVVALIIFGPEKLPELARNLGKLMAEFRRHTGDLRSNFEGHMRDLEREAQERRIAGAAGAASEPAPRASEPEIVPAAGTVTADRPNAATIAEPPPPETDPAGMSSRDVLERSTISEPVPNPEEVSEEVSNDGSVGPA